VRSWQRPSKQLGRQTATRSHLPRVRSARPRCVFTRRRGLCETRETSSRCDATERAAVETALATRRRVSTSVRAKLLIVPRARGVDARSPLHEHRRSHSADRASRTAEYLGRPFVPACIDTECRDVPAGLTSTTASHCGGPMWFPPIETSRQSGGMIGLREPREEQDAGKTGRKMHSSYVPVFPVLRPYSLTCGARANPDRFLRAGVSIHCCPTLPRLQRSQSSKSVIPSARPRPEAKLCLTAEP
jgi:hypothetical protein